MPKAIVSMTTRDIWRRTRYQNDPVYRQRIIDRVTIYRKNNPEKIAETKKTHWENNRDKYRMWSAEYTRRRLGYIYDKLGNKCVRCGFGDLRAIHIHHIYGKERKLDWMKLDYDLSKLELLCANCHNIHHYKDNSRNIS